MTLADLKFSGWTLPDHEDFKERVAIMVVEGGMPEDEATDYAIQHVNARREIEFWNRHKDQPAWKEKYAEWLKSKGAKS